jgi:hypothetical protein
MTIHIYPNDGTANNLNNTIGIPAAISGGKRGRYDAISRLTEVKTRDLAVSQMRWRQGSLGSNFYAGSPDGKNNSTDGLGFSQQRQFSFNLISAKCDMITGYQRQHRKNGIVQARLPDGEKLAEQLNKCLEYVNALNNIPNCFSRLCEQGMLTGLVFGEVQTDYSKDPINGDPCLKVWEYNSFLHDPYTRDIHSLKDCGYIATQYFSTKREAILAYPEARQEIERLGSARTGSGVFYFLPENISSHMTDMVIITRFWEPETLQEPIWVHLVTEERIFEKPPNEEMYKKFLCDKTVWRLSVLCNDVLVHTESAPDNIEEIPFVAATWNYDPWIANITLRCRGLPYTMSSCQYLLNRTTTLGHSACESSVNSGWIYEQGSIVDEDKIRKAGEGATIQYKPDRPPPQQIQSHVLPQSNFELVNRLQNFMNIVSGVNEELLGMATDSKAGITEMLRQGAGLVGLQKYFDNWDVSLERLTEKLVNNITANWSAAKFSRVIGVPPEELEDFKNFNLRDFSIICTEGMYSDNQRRAEFMNIVELCSLLGVKPPIDLLVNKAPIQGKLDLIAALQKEEESQKQAQAEQKSMEQAVLYAELQRTHAQTVDALNLAKERAARAESNMGLKDEREAEVSKNKALSEKTRIEALSQLLELISVYGTDKVKNAVEGLGLERESPSIVPEPDTPEDNLNGQTSPTLPESSLEPQGERPPVGL